MEAAFECEISDDCLESFSLDRSWQEDDLLKIKKEVDKQIIPQLVQRTPYSETQVRFLYSTHTLGVTGKTYWSCSSVG